MPITLPAPQKPMQFAPVEDDGDELSQAIQNDPVVHEDNWDLREDVDAEKISMFLDDALKELGAEPSEDQ